MVQISSFEPDNPRFQALLSRSRDVPPEIIRSVEAIIEDVRDSGDEALFRYMSEIDEIELDRGNVLVSEEEYKEAYEEIDPSFSSALQEACANLFTFHQHQLQKSYSVEQPNGVVLERRTTPIERIGICVPAGTAPLCSSLYMNLIPALTAGVPEIYIIAAPRGGGIDKHILYTADYLGVRNVMKISGAQGVAALAYGTGSVPSVDKVVGPGNLYTQTAKRLLIGQIGIDSFAGPSELAVITDESTPERFTAADLLSQAEHGSGFEASVVFCLSLEKAKAIQASIEELIQSHALKDRVSPALNRFGNIFVVDTIRTAVGAVNSMAPEHVEVMCDNAESIAEGITNAGAVFVGPYSPEPVGDYYCGTNHILPTSGAARYSSGLGVQDFLRSYSIIKYTRKALTENASSIRILAEAEGMEAHSLSISVREKAIEKEGPADG